MGLVRGKEKAREESRRTEGDDIRGGVQQVERRQKMVRGVHFSDIPRGCPISIDCN